MSFHLKILDIFYLEKRFVPICGNNKLRRKSKHEFDKIDYMKGRYNLTETDYYNSTFIYECNRCEKSFTIEGLMNSLDCKDNSENNGNLDMIKPVVKKMESRNKRRVLKILAFIILCMLLISIINSIYLRAIGILYISLPVIALFAGVLILIYKKK